MIGIYKIVTAAIFIRKFDLHNLSSQTIIHAHFLSTGTDVAILIKCAFPKLVIVATGHGSDVLFQSEEKAINLYSNLDQIYMASQAVMDKFIHNCASTEDHQSPDLILRYCRIPDNHNLPKTNFMKFENSKLEILTVARFHPQKGLDIAIQCAHLLKLRKVDFNWNFIGDGDLRQTLEAQVASYDLKNHVTFLGVRTREYVQECMRKSDIFSLTSVKSKGASDGLPVAILEAMDLGAYVITTDVGGISEAINAKRGSLIEPNAKALFAEIQKVNARGKENREYTVRARQWVTQNCKRSEMDPLLIGYRELLRLK
jgi:glycosyltransferase involved in cell wall biosynthesis